MIFILAIIATEALTEIVVHSELFAGIRKELSMFWFFREMLECGWCVSVWMAGLVVLLIYFRLEILLVPVAIHRLSNIFHEIYGRLRR